MLRKTIEVEVDDDLIQEVITRYGVHSAREAINLALRTLIAEAHTESWQQDGEYDEFSDLRAWQPQHSTETS